MGDGTADKLKGHAKEATGDVTGDKDLQREGKVDRASGSDKDKVGDAGDKDKDAIRTDRRPPVHGAHRKSVPDNLVLGR